MKKEYCLTHQNEVARQEFQAKGANYSLEKELHKLVLRSGEKVLDAGCGTGHLSRYLARKFPGIVISGYDRSSDSIAFARAEAAKFPNQVMDFFPSPLEKMPVKSDSQDWVFCHHVFEHLKDPVVVAEEFQRILKPGGHACVIDFDGILFNLYSPNLELMDMLSVVQCKLECDLFVGRKIPTIMKRAGFAVESWEVQICQFKGEDLQHEYDLTVQRLNQVNDWLTEIFGGQTLAERFSQIYCQEMLKAETVFFYNKVIVYAAKMN